MPALLRFGSWMGGDRDGNPFVTPEVTIETVRLLRMAGLRRQISAIEELSHRLGQSIRQVAISEELQRSLDDDAARFPNRGRAAGTPQPVRAIPPEMYLHS